MARMLNQWLKVIAVALMVGLSASTTADVQDGVQAGNSEASTSQPQSGSTEEFRQLVQGKAEDYAGQVVGRALARQRALIETAVGLKPDLQPETAGEAFRQSLTLTAGDLLADAGKHYASGALNGQLLAYDPNRVADIGAAGLAEAAQATFRFSNFAALKHIEIEAGFSNGKPKLSLLTVIPIVGWASARQTPDAAPRHNWFTQLSYDLRSRDETDRQTFNAGLGYRYLTPNENWLYGANVFLDYEAPYDHSRVGLGLEAITHNLGIRANLYIAATQWRDAQRYYQERALDGADIELEGALPNHPEWRGFLRAYQFNRYEDKNDLTGVAASIEYSPFPALTIKTEVEDNNEESTHLNFGAQFKYRFGMPWKEQLKPQNIKHIFADLKNRRYEKVRRENIIRTQKRQHPDVVGTITLTIGANSLSGTGGNRTAAVGLTILFGTLITVEDTVADTARLNVRFGDGAMLEIGDGSTVRIEEGVIRLLSGVLRYTSNGGTITNLVTPNASVQLLGTVVELLDEGGNIASRVTQGSIALTVAGSTLNRSATSTGCSTGAAPVACTTGNAQYDALDTAVTNSFEISKYEVTFDDWMECVNDAGNPLVCTHAPSDNGFGTGSKPVINVSYNDITQQYLPWLNDKTGKSYRLPTESEWEYVTRAGTSTVYNVGDTITCGARRLFAQYPVLRSLRLSQ